ncbi:MAG: precorrin-3B C(17)-methyltransferase [Streptosporangiales bacterium]|nr:precorrin-3B C(17)-methyltransferase [Streptosporangiales bacterium]
MTIALIAATAAGRSAAHRLAQAWPEETRVYDERAKTAVEQAWRDCDALVCFLAVGATVRLVAPLLADKHTDPAVVCVDESAQHAVALLGGHGAGANELATRVADVLGATPVITTATDAATVPGLDMLGWPVEGATAAVGRAMLDGEPVRLECDATWPLPAFPPNVSVGGRLPDDGTHRVVITDTDIAADDGHTVVLRPPSLVVGVGASKGAPADEVADLVQRALRESGLSPSSVCALATVDAKRDEPGVVATAERYGWALHTYPAERLATVEVPNPSDAAQRAVGTPSVAEASALVGAAELVVQKRKSAMATVAIARVRPRGRLAVVGIGPGARDLLPQKATDELRRASVVVGLDQYIDQVRDLLRPGTSIRATGLGDEEARARSAVDAAAAGNAVALLGSGDAGVYAMASPALDLAGDDIDVTAVPGITANLAASALLGAPLGHDHAVVSLSDLNTPWAAIERRVQAAAEADYVVTFYNPRSAGRHWQLGKAVGLLAEHRPPHTPVGVVRHATRAEEHVELTTLADFDETTVDMACLVIVGSTNSRIRSGRMVTPRGYRWSR